MLDHALETLAGISDRARIAGGIRVRAGTAARTIRRRGRIHHIGQDTRVRLRFDDLLWRALVQVGMRFELEEKVETIDQKQNHACAAANSDHGSVGCIGLFVFEGSVEGSLHVRSA